MSLRTLRTLSGHLNSLFCGLYSCIGFGKILNEKNYSSAHAQLFYRTLFTASDHGIVFAEG